MKKAASLSFDRELAFQVQGHVDMWVLADILQWHPDRGLSHMVSCTSVRALKVHHRHLDFCNPR